MANQHTLTIPLSQATERQLLVHIASRMETHMADMTAALDRLAASPCEGDRGYPRRAPHPDRRADCRVAGREVGPCREGR